jgi:hypothetical protein
MARIFEAISNIMAEIRPIGKNKDNKQQGFKYRGVDEVMNTLQPALVKHKVFIVPEILEQTREEKTTKTGSVLIYSICKIRFTFYADDGSSISSIVIGEGMDSGDKSTNKAMAIAFKYACFQVFCIPTEEMKDPDRNSPPELAGKEPQNEDPVINDMKIKTLRSMMEKTGTAEDDLLGYYQVKKISEMKTSTWMQAMSALEDKQKKLEAKKHSSEKIL